MQHQLRPQPAHALAETRLRLPASAGNLRDQRADGLHLITTSQDVPGTRNASRWLSNRIASLTVRLKPGGLQPPITHPQHFERKGQIWPAAIRRLDGGIPACDSLLIQIEMFSIDIDGLKDDASWRRLTVSLLDAPVSEEWLETMRIGLMERLRYITDKAQADH